MFSKTISISAKIIANSNIGSLLTRLMVAVNDISLANFFYGLSAQETFFKDESQREGARLYFVRLQIGHLAETKILVNQFEVERQKNLEVERVFEKTISPFKEKYQYLVNYINDKKFKDYIKKLRHQTVFHYKDENKIFEEALREEYWFTTDRRYTLSIGDPGAIRFEFADEFLKFITKNYIWKPKNINNLLDRAVSIEKDCNDLCEIFAHFFSSFLYQYFNEN